MSQFREGNIIGFKAGANLAAKQFFILKMHASNDNEVILASGGTDKMIGVLQNEPADNAAATVKPINASGTGKVIAGGAITRGAKLTSDSNGEAVVTTSSADRVFGLALETADDGDIFEYLCVNEEIA